MFASFLRKQQRCANMLRDLLAAAMCRRTLVASLLGIAVLPPPEPAHADLDILSRFTALQRDRLVSTKAVKVRAIPRGRLSQDFAVLLMRTSYSVADELDFMAMNEFQRDQFLFRQNEWDLYRSELPAVVQGDLTDPAYFDFISFCQHVTLADGMRRGKLVFVELIDANGTETLVQRDPLLPQTNEALPALHATLVGDRVLDWMLERYPSNVAPAVLMQPAIAPLLDNIRRLGDIFEINNFALTQSVAPLADGNGIQWTLVAPANLWSAQVLKIRGDVPSNDFDTKVMLAYLRRCGIPASSVSRFEKGTQVVHEIRWPSGFVRT